MHQLDVLLVLTIGAGGNFVEPFTEVAFGDASEPGEGAEEVIVSSDAGR